MSRRKKESAPPRFDLGTKTEPTAPDILPDGVNRRSSQRFLLRLPGKCRRVEQPSVYGRAATCHCINISSTGMLFSTTEIFQPGQTVEAFIDWPLRHDDGAHLALVVEGPVVWKSDVLTAIRFERYQFRTRGSNAAVRPWRALRAPAGQSRRNSEPRLRMPGAA